MNKLTLNRLVWHTVYVRELEIALQSIDPTVSVPYWDWTIDSALANPASSIVYTPAYFGSVTTAANNYSVIDGRMSYFPVATNLALSPYGYLRSSDNYNTSPYVTRNPGVTSILLL